jgi:transcriptional regulator with XRE-family HTH domain
MGRLAGRGISPSQVTRWENGTTPVFEDTLSWYEKVLSLPPHSLRVVADAALRFSNVRGPRSRHAGPGDELRLHDLLDRALRSGAMSSSSWLELTSLVRRRPELVLHPPRLWDAITENLLSELVIAEDTAWLARQESLSRLLEHPAAAPHAVDSCVAMAKDDAVPVHLEPTSLLDVTPVVSANRFVWTQVVRPDNANLLQGALLAAVSKSRRGHFRNSEKVAMLGAAVELLNSDAIDPALALPAAELAGVLWAQCADSPPAKSSRPFPGTGAQIWLPHRRADMADVNALCARIALRAQAGLDAEPLPSDDLLPDLVRGTLFSSNLDDRLYSAMLLAATPYRRPLIGVLLDELSSGLLRRHEPVVLSVFQALNTLNSTEHQTIVCRLLLDDSTGIRLRQAAARSMPHHAGHLTASCWARIARCQLDNYLRCPSPEHAAVLHSIVYGISTDGHRGLAAEIRDDARIPAQVRAAARWWINIPSSVRSAAVA